MLWEKFFLRSTYTECIIWLLVHFSQPIPKKSFHSIVSSSDSTQARSIFIPKKFLKHLPDTILCVGDTVMNETDKNAIPHGVLILMRPDGKYLSLPSSLFLHSFIQAFFPPMQSQLLELLKVGAWSLDSRHTDPNRELAVLLLMFLMMVPGGVTGFGSRGTLLLLFGIL